MLLALAAADAENPVRTGLVAARMLWDIKDLRRQGRCAAIAGTTFAVGGSGQLLPLTRKREDFVSAKDYSVLITDDDREYRETLRELVEPEGYRTVLASSGEEALEIIQVEHIHLALFDMHMPRMTGVETVEIVHQFNAILPCILVTADPNEDVMRQAFRVQVFSVLPKPVSKNTLLYTMLRALMKVYGDLLREEQDENL
jgi:CheY-like chemotaxis protein